MTVSFNFDRSTILVGMHAQRKIHGRRGDADFFFPQFHQTSVEYSALLLARSIFPNFSRCLFPPARLEPHRSIVIKLVLDDEHCDFLRFCRDKGELMMTDFLRKSIDLDSTLISKILKFRPISSSVTSFSVLLSQILF